MTHLNLTSLAKKQLNAPLWDFKGTPAVHPIYQELRTRPPGVTSKFSDPDWESKTDALLKQAIGLDKYSSERA